MKILLQTSVPYAHDDWNISRFGILHAFLEQSGFDVISRDREPDAEGDPLLRRIDESDFDQLWLFAVDAGSGLDEKECDAITRFRESGRGLLVTRDHQDLGSSICSIGGLGAAHYFHSRNLDPDPSRRRRDDVRARDIDWPNYHSGENGNYQPITVAGGDHPLLRREDGSNVQWFPAHPHEGAVGVPPSDRTARVIAVGTSTVSGHQFNLIVAFEGDARQGRGIAESSFHHFCDYNWNPRAGCPSFVTDPEGDEVLRDPARLDDIRAYARNIARWLGPEGSAAPSA
jgi:hypothetical protein